MRNMKNRKAVSPVIATVILVAVAITVSVAVSYWMGGISSQYTQFEKVEIQTGYSTKVTGVNGGWDCILEIKNTGSQSATIGTVFVNEVPLNATELEGYSCPSLAEAVNRINIACNFTYADGLTLQSGQTGVVHVYVPTGYGYFSSGTTLDIKLHSATGMDYIKLIKLV